MWSAAVGVLRICVFCFELKEIIVTCGEVKYDLLATQNRVPVAAVMAVYDDRRYTKISSLMINMFYEPNVKPNFFLPLLSAAFPLQSCGAAGISLCPRTEPPAGC